MADQGHLREGSLCRSAACRRSTRRRRHRACRHSRQHGRATNRWPECHAAEVPTITDSATSPPPAARAPPRSSTSTLRWTSPAVRKPRTDAAVHAPQSTDSPASPHRGGTGRETNTAATTSAGSWRAPGPTTAISTSSAHLPPQLGDLSRKPCDPLSLPYDQSCKLLMRQARTSRQRP